MLIWIQSHMLIVAVFVAAMIVGAVLADRAYR